MDNINPYVQETLSSNESSLSSSSNTEAPQSGGALYIILAIASPIMFSLTNLVDKTAVSGRVKHTPSYVMMIGVFDCIVAAIIACCCDWSAEALAGTRVIDFFFPVFSSFFWALTIYFYFGSILIADASIVIGIESAYPFITVILSAIFLHERIASLGYIGCVLLVLGAVALSINPIGMIRARCKKASKDGNIIAEPSSPATDSSPAPPNTTSESATSKSEFDEEAGCAPGVSCWFPCVNCFRKMQTKSDSMTEIRNETPSVVADDEIDETFENTIVLDVVRPKSEEEEEEKEDREKEEHNCFARIIASYQKHRNSKTLLVTLLVFVCLSAAVYSFMAKVSTNGLNPFNVCSINFFVFGLFMLSLGFVTPLKGAKYFVSEFKRNWLFCLLSDIFTLAGQVCVIVAMSGLPASIASCLSGIQPFCVLCLERVFGIASDTWKECLTYKLIPIFFIVGGLIILSLLSV